MKVIVYDPWVDGEVLREMGVRRVDLATLLSESDVVSIHCLLTPETRHMIGERELGMMKRTAVIVNTARGGIIDEKALYKALAEGRIKCAGLDVFEAEPLERDNPLLTLKNVVLTPHMAVQTADAVLRLLYNVGVQPR